MAAHEQSEAQRLTPYEAEQVERIAAWKGEHPAVLGEVFRLVAQPVAAIAERVIPDAAARRIVDVTYKGAEAAAWRREIEFRAGVKDVGELRHKPLEECDRLVLQVGRSAEALAAAEGALTGAGGVLTTVLDVPLLFGVALRTIMRIGHCYGFPLDRKTDRAYVLGILVAALANTRERKQHLLVRLRDVKDLLLEEAQENLVTEEAASILFQLEIFEGVPGVGAVSGAFLNYGALYRVQRAARHVFQERWLHEHGKVVHIEPAADTRRVPARGDWAGILGRAAYHGSYYVGFGAAFPVYAALSLLPRDNALMRGVKDGASAAGGGVDRVVGRWHRAVGSRPPEADMTAAPA